MVNRRSSTPSARTHGRGARRLAIGTLVALALVAGVEGLLRFCGLPRGTFAGAFATATGLWEPGFDGVIRTGAVPYRVQANSLGLRGDELRTGAAAARQRIVAIGDSSTDGFFVDNPATYPARLELELRARGFDAEVVNAARGGGSIDRFTQILETVALPLSPAVVIVTLVTNDVHELGHYRLPTGVSGTLTHALPQLLVTRTAIGEALLDAYLRVRSPVYRARLDARPAAGDELSDARYRIPGNADYRANAEAFRARFAGGDGRLLGDRFDADIEQAFRRYLDELARFFAVARGAGAQVLFVFVPAYSQVYLLDSPTHLRDRLGDAVARLGGRFVDLAPGLRAATERDGPLHLAPLDFHFNPAGNRAIAGILADALVESGWLVR